MPGTTTLRLTDAQIDEAALRQAPRDTARTALLPRGGVRGGFARGLDLAGRRRLPGPLARGSWGRDEDEPDDEKETAR